jgi:hypothetical protein
MTETAAANARAEAETTRIRKERREAFVSSLAAFLPEIVKTHIFNTLDHFDASLKLPLALTFRTVCLFCAKETPSPKPHTAANANASAYRLRTTCS